VVRTWTRAIVSGIAALTLMEAAAPARAAVKLNPQYLDLLHLYARGERAVAVAGLGKWSESALQKQVGIMENAAVVAERCLDCPKQSLGALLRAAAMLHADRDKVDKPEPVGREQKPLCPGPHARIAGRYARVMARDPETQDFARRFFLTRALLWQHRACFDDALLEARAGIELFPRDAKLLFTAGCVLEEQAILMVASGRNDWPVAMPQEWLKDARRDFTDAVASDPDLILGRVRLGRVLWRLGEAEPAREVLEGALARGRDPDHLYLAHLFLGRIHEDAQRLDEALAQYRRAVDVRPEAQSAAVALAHALQLTGDLEGSRQALARGIAGQRGAGDAYLDYLAGNTVEADRMWAALHREALE
jgi:tetratricopeptide (TPR) repeat protein